MLSVIMEKFLESAKKKLMKKKKTTTVHSFEYLLLYLIHDIHYQHETLDIFFNYSLVSIPANICLIQKTADGHVHTGSHLTGSGQCQS